jgi:hypothetical protein
MARSPEITKVIQGSHVQVKVTAHSLRSGVLPELRYVALISLLRHGTKFRRECCWKYPVPLTVLGNHHFVELRDTDRAVNITKVDLVFLASRPWAGSD